LGSRGNGDGNISSWLSIESHFVYIAAIAFEYVGTAKWFKENDSGST